MANSIVFHRFLRENPVVLTFKIRKPSTNAIFHRN